MFDPCITHQICEFSEVEGARLRRFSQPVTAMIFGESKCATLLENASIWPWPSAPWPTSPAADLTLAELARACAIATLAAGGEQRMKKWLEAVGHESVWSISSERLEAAAHALREHGYAPASVNRDLSRL